eukprot:4796294-Prymnesium_polylepis.1
MYGCASTTAAAHEHAGSAALTLSSQSARAAPPRRAATGSDAGRNCASFRLCAFILDHCLVAAFHFAA